VSRELTDIVAKEWQMENFYGRNVYFLGKDKMLYLLLFLFVRLFDALYANQSGVPKIYSKIPIWIILINIEST
jgi:hypothetical protein